MNIEEILEQKRIASLGDFTVASLLSITDANVRVRIVPSHTDLFVEGSVYDVYDSCVYCDWFVSFVNVKDGVLYIEVKDSLEDEELEEFGG